MESHSLSSYAYKASNLKMFECSDLNFTSEENRATLFDMTEKIFANALSLEKLDLSLSETCGSDGRSML